MRLFKIILICMFALAATEPAFAYVGPGAGLTFIGSLLALIGAVLAGIFGFIWYPIKRLLRLRKAKRKDADGTDPE
ncbi:MAG: hypothetical protein ABI395_04945 [Sphingobium sp.]